MIVCIAGASCTGKTNLALELVAQNPIFEIISVDSVMVYEGLNIGSAKPSQDILASNPHHLVDIRKFYESYNVGEFVEDSKTLIADIQTRSKIPLLVGGTMMYFNALINGLHALPPVPIEIIDNLERQIQSEGLDSLYTHLREVDPQTKIHANDHQRIIRALGFWQATGDTLANYYISSEPQKLAEKVYFFNLTAGNRQELERNIKARAKSVLRLGLVEEVEGLLTKWQELRQDGKEIPASLQTITYKEVVSFLQNAGKLEHLEEEIVMSIKRLVKMQFTWTKSKFPYKIDIDFRNRENTKKIIETIGK